MTFDVARAQRALAEWFAPWVAELGLVVEECRTGFVRVRQPHDLKFSRGIGGMSGQAIMAAIDTTMVLAVQTTLAEERVITTVSQTTSFLRPIGPVDALYEITVVKAGRTLAFGTALVYEEHGRDKPAATASLTYAILPPPG